MIFRTDLSENMSDINTIGYTIDHYKKVDNGRLRKEIINHLDNPTTEDIKDAENFIHSYLGLVQPTLTHLKNTGISSQLTKKITPIIDDCVAYFKRNNDYLNDHQHGLYGLLDDAYRTMCIISVVQQNVSDIQLPFDNDKLNRLNKSLISFLPKEVIEKINVDVFKIRTNLLLDEISDWAQQKKETAKSKPSTLTLTNKKLNFPFDIYPLPTDLSALKNKKGIFAYTRLETKDGKSTHYILYIGKAMNMAAIPQEKDKETIKNHQPTHICIYTYSQDDKTINEWTTSLIHYYRPPFNLSNLQKTKPSATSQHATYRPKMKNCTTCNGSGTKVCSSCGGRGGNYQSRVDYDWEGRPVTRDEWINCYSCSGGYSKCFSCGGKGEVYA